MSLYDYSRWDNFTKDELSCQHTGLENPNVGAFIYLMDAVQELRGYFNFPFGVNSGYRHETHPIEASKVRPGLHNYAAIDIVIPTEHCWEVLEKAFELGFKGIGINLTGDPSRRFIHLDMRDSPPRVWSYPS